MKREARINRTTAVQEAYFLNKRLPAEPHDNYRIAVNTMICLAAILVSISYLLIFVNVFSDGFFIVGMD